LQALCNAVFQVENEGTRSRSRSGSLRSRTACRTRWPG
jgi:hypothetical protein